MGRGEQKLIRRGGEVEEVREYEEKFSWRKRAVEKEGDEKVEKDKDKDEGEGEGEHEHEHKRRSLRTDIPKYAADFSQLHSKA
eukprot:768676-Hanusia_phi.AAC.4